MSTCAWYFIFTLKYSKILLFLFQIWWWLSQLMLAWPLSSWFPICRVTSTEVINPPCLPPINQHHLDTAKKILREAEHTSYFAQLSNSQIKPLDSLLSNTWCVTATHLFQCQPADPGLASDDDATEPSQHLRLFHGGDLPQQHQPADIWENSGNSCRIVWILVPFHCIQNPGENLNLVEMFGNKLI